ncbi:unnamed protein product [Knipowitschia caucasica]
MPYVSGEDTVKELRRALCNPNVQSDLLRYRSTITRVIRAMSQGVDVSGLFPEMVKACATVDIVQKKQVYVFLCSYAALKPDLSLLVINTLRKDCQDANPMVRSLALRNMTNLRLPGLVEYVEQPLSSGLRDRAACVRRVAVLGWAKVHNLDPGVDIDPAVVNELYSLLRDPDPIVMVNCLRALEEILKDEGGVAINKAITHHLLYRLKECDVWAQCDVLRVLERYPPQTEGELFDMLSVLDPCLVSSHAPVTAATLRLFLCLCSSLPAVCFSALERVCGPLLVICGSSSREMRFTALAHIQLLLQSEPGLLGAHYKRFFCGYAEPAFIKQRKMQMLVELVNDENAWMILDELRGYCTDVNADTAQAAISAIGRIGRSYSEKCLEILTELLGLKQEHVTSAVVQTLRDLVWTCPQCCDAVCSAIEGCEQAIQDAQGRQALLWLLGEYGECIPSAPYVLESFIDGIRLENSVCVKMELLSAAVRLFVCRPAETQDMLGRLLHYSIEEESDMCVRDQAVLYYRLLHYGIEAVRGLVQVKRTDPDLGVLVGRPQISVSSWAHSFNTLQPLCEAATPASSIRASPQLVHTALSRELKACPEEPLCTDADQSTGPLASADGSLAEAVCLSVSPAITPEKFQELWLQNVHADTGAPNSTECDFLHVEKLLRCPPILAHSPQGLKVALQLVNIQMLAFTPAHSHPWKCYLYTHTQRSSPSTHNTLILGQLLCSGHTDADEGDHATARGTCGVKVTLMQKPRDEAALGGFLSILCKVLNTLTILRESGTEDTADLSEREKSLPSNLSLSC